MLKLGTISGLLIALLAFMGGCMPAGGEEGEAGGFGWEIIVFLIVIFGLFYLLMIRPQRKRQQQHTDMVRELQKGDRVVTAGGIYGQIESMDEESVVLKMESGASIRVARTSVAGRQQQK